MKTFNSFVLSITLFSFFNAFVYANTIDMGDPAVKDLYQRCKHANPRMGEEVDIGGTTCGRDENGQLYVEVLNQSSSLQREIKLAEGVPVNININEDWHITAPPTMANVEVDGGWEWYDTLLLGLGSAALATLTGFFIAWCVTPEDNFWGYR